MKRLVGAAAIVLVLAAGVALAQQAPAQPGMGGPGHQMPMLLKAMGDVLIKYGKAMEGAAR